MIPSDTSYLDELNDIQRKAVETTDGPVLIVAGPGSGKTRVLTYRIAHLMNKGVAPWNILALTFTNKAAREMKERIEKVVGPKVNDVWAGTFHSIFARILRVEAEKIGYPSDFTIYDTDDTKNVIKNILKDMNLDAKVYNVNSIKNRISSAKSNLITPKLYAQNEQLKTEDRMGKMPFIFKIYAEYIRRCKRSGAMDFDDLLFRLFELFQANKDGVLDKYRKRFSHVMVDEFQDTNQLQYAIVRKLVNYPESERNICVVGDDAQSIYAFRGATIQNILDYETDFKKHGIQVFKLEQNYRSTEHIVQAANSIILNNSKQIQKKIWSHKGDGQRIKLLKVKTDNEEGKRIADTIVEQRNRYHLSNSDFAVLYRTNAQSRVFEEYLRRFNIPYKIFGGLSFYQRKEVKDLVAYLRMVVNANDDEALRRVINFPKRGIGKTTVDKISDLAVKASTPLWEQLPYVQASTKAKNSIAGFIKMVKKAQKMAETENAFDVAHFIAKESKLAELIKGDNSIEGMGRQENFNSLLDGIQSFVDGDGAEANILGIQNDEAVHKSLAAYLQNIALHTDADKEGEDDDHVTLMSVHAAKGLEFKSVFVVGMEQTLFPSFMSLDSAEGIDEERRLFYVAITRAEQFLTLTYAESRYQYGKSRMNPPSQFLSEIPSVHLETVFGSHGGAPMMRSAQGGHNNGQRSGVQGNFKRKSPIRNFANVDATNFKPSPMSAIVPGVEVLHLKFGKGKVLSVESGVATIFFKDIADSQKRIMLKFAKLQVL